MMRNYLCGAVALMAVAIAPILLAQSAQGYQQLTVPYASVVTISDAVKSGATSCRGSLETANIRVTYNGTTPTVTVGQPVNVGDSVVLGNKSDIINFKATASTAISGTLNLTCSSDTRPVESSVIRAFYDPGPIGGGCNALLRAAQVCR